MKSAFNGVYLVYMCFLVLATNATMLKKFGPGTEYYAQTTELDLKRTYM